MNLQMIAKMMGINPQIVDQVTQLGSKYSQDVNGLIQAISEHGGMAKVEEAMGYLNNPIVQKGLSMIGVDKSVIETAYSQLKSMPLNNAKTPLSPNQANVNAYMEKLKALRR